MLHAWHDIQPCHIICRLVFQGQIQNMNVEEPQVVDSQRSEPRYNNAGFKFCVQLETRRAYFSPAEQRWNLLLTPKGNELVYSRNVLP